MLAPELQSILEKGFYYDCLSELERACVRYWRDNVAKTDNMANVSAFVLGRVCFSLCERIDQDQSQQAQNRIASIMTLPMRELIATIDSPDATKHVQALNGLLGAFEKIG